jgi:4-aminobutyrate aminotransferase-like enzyme
MSGATNQLPRPALLTVEEAKQLSAAATADLFCRHLNPGQFHFLKLLGFHTVLVERAEGMHYIDRDGRRILDFFGGFGSVGFGHNHPRITAARIRFQNERRHEIAMAFLSQYAAAPAQNLAAIAPGDLDMVFLGSSGSEVVEAALKLAERVRGPSAPRSPMPRGRSTARPAVRSRSPTRRSTRTASTCSTTACGCLSATPRRSRRPSSGTRRSVC